MATDSQEVQATQMEDSQLPEPETQVIDDSQMAEPEAEQWSRDFDDSQLAEPAASAIDLDDSQEQAEATQHAADEEEAAFWYTEQDISHVLVMLESMQQTLPRNKYTTPVIEDIESLQVECTLIMSTSAAASNEPEDTGSIKLTIRTHLAMKKYAEIKALVDNIMDEKKHLKRRASDPPAGGDDDDDDDADASSSCNTKAAKPTDRAAKD
jgi:hypothetical protein